MNQFVAEKAVEGELLKRFLDPRYFYMLAAFSLFSDCFLSLTIGLSIWDAKAMLTEPVPLGYALVLVGSFSLLAAFISPLIFTVINCTFWEIYYILPYWLRPAPSIPTRVTTGAYLSEIKLWAIKNNNAVAMAIVNAREAQISELADNRPLPFLLALCLGANYLLAPLGLLRSGESHFAAAGQMYFAIVLWGLVGFLALVSLNGVMKDGHYIYLKGLGDLIKS